MKIHAVPIQKTSFIPLTREAYAKQHYVARHYGITAEMFAKGKLMVCPQVFSKNPGSGKFGAFLDDLKASCSAMGMTLAFACITNEGLYKYMERHKIPVLTNDGILCDVICEKTSV